MNALLVSSLTKRFAEMAAVDRVDLEVREGELLAILGPSGCGKTTLLRLVTGQLDPDEGRIEIMGKDVSQVPTHKRNIGFVFQSFALFPHMTVLENVAFPLLVRGVGREERMRRAGEFLEIARLGEFADVYPGNLSGGEQQRVGLARALVYRPGLILLDEPLSNLDAKLREEMRLEVRRIIKELGMTAVHVTHDQEEALSISDRLAVMEKGRVLQAASPVEVYRKPATAFVARFVGGSNLIPAVAVSPGGCVLRGTDVTLETADRFEEGTPLLLVVKPDDLSVQRGSREEKEPAGSGLAGTILSSSYRGGRSEYRIEVGVGEELELRALSRGESYSAGTRVFVSFPGGGLHAIPERKRA